jgi:Flp pilus assembly protein TadB
LAIGELPAAALKATAFDAPLFAPAAAAVTVGGDPVAALRTMAQQPGCDILMRLADSWQVCLRTGMPLGDTVSAVVQNVEREIEYEATREAELATTRTTGRMLAVLPLVGLLMGFAVGADPFAFITGSVFGQWCLLGACCFAGGGLIWTELLGDPDRLHAPEQRKSQRNIVPQLTAMLPGSRRRNTTWHLDSVVSPSEKAAEQAGFAATLELLAAVISAGLPLRSATSIVGEVIAGSLGKRLRGVWALTDIGFGDAAAWRSLQHHSLWGEVARQVAHSADSGAGLSLLLRRAASRHRDKMAANLMVQVRSIGAKAALPLVVCYLPAFLLVGVLPIIGSLVTEYF